MCKFHLFCRLFPECGSATVHDQHSLCLCQNTSGYFLQAGNWESFLIKKIAVIYDLNMTIFFSPSTKLTVWDKSFLCLHNVFNCVLNFLKDPRAGAKHVDFAGNARAVGPPLLRAACRHQVLPEEGGPGEM